MRGKLTLNLDDLSVDSFDTTSTHKARGTVFGEQCTCYTQCTCPGCPTCDATCNYTCDDATCPNCPTCAASCNGTCNCGTGGYSCYETNCCPVEETCLQTGCGREVCCPY
ncbi:MAG TPA: hypothetical protein VGC13_09500 [Longimicrobium sp.]|jgi:hypothetical protein|uniref:hypothetical protein n=1 Tax=Longimicrobium sp. TaxID=2029185 RepID=UPI002ED8175B